MEDLFSIFLEQERGRRLAAVSAELAAAVLAGDTLAAAPLRAKWMALKTFGAGLERPGDNASPDEVLASVREQIPADFPDPKTAKLAAIGAELERRMVVGFTYQGVVYQLNDASQMRITALALKAQRAVDGAPGATWEEGFAFIAADNTPVPFTAEEFGPFADAAANVVIARRLNARALKDAVLAAANAEDIAAIDIKTGW